MPRKTSAKARKTSRSTKTSKAPTAEEKPPVDDSLAAYLRFAREGDAGAVSADARFWVAELSQGGHTTSLYGRSREEIEQRARAILAARGVDI